MNFMRLIKEGPCHAFYNMALDEALSEAVRERRSPPTLRLYGWDRPSLSLGCFQKASDINRDHCRAKGYPVVRRQTGGRAILHDAELTYSVCASVEDTLFQGGLRGNYRALSDVLVLALNKLGIEAVASYARTRQHGDRSSACFRSLSYGEITVSGSKVIGSAQKRFRNGFLQHGSILLDASPRELCTVLFNEDEEGLSRMGALKRSVPDLSVESLTDALKEAVEEGLDVKLISDGPTDYEQKLAAQLEAEKYSSDGWNFRR